MIKTNCNRLLGIIFGILFIQLTACENKDSVKLVEWHKVDMFQLPQQVIDFYYAADDNPKKIFFIMDTAYQADEKFTKISNLSETHYTLQINHQPINVRERDFRAPYLIFNGVMYYSKSRILKGKLMTPQDLFIYAVDLKKILN